MSSSRKNVWNLAVVNNIDFKEKNFKFDNIYDITQKSSHTTLRMAFQMQLLIDIIRPEEVVELTVNISLFDMNPEISNIFQETLEELLNFKNIHNELSYKKDFDVENIKCIILFKLN